MFQCQTAVMSPTEYTRYKVMVQMTYRMFWYDRLIASCAARTSNVVPYDVIDRVLQVSDPFSENASYPFF